MFQSGEITGPLLATHHNLAFFARLMSDLREWITDESRVDLTWLESYSEPDA